MPKTNVQPPIGKIQKFYPLKATGGLVYVLDCMNGQCRIIKAWSPDKTHVIDASEINFEDEIYPRRLKRLEYFLQEEPMPIMESSFGMAAVEEQVINIIERIKYYNPAFNERDLIADFDLMEELKALQRKSSKVYADAAKVQNESLESPEGIEATKIVAEHNAMIQQLIDTINR